MQAGNFYMYLDTQYSYSAVYSMSQMWTQMKSTLGEPLRDIIQKELEESDLGKRVVYKLSKC